MGGPPFCYELKLLYIFQDKYRKMIRNVRPKEGCRGREKTDTGPIKKGPKNVE